MTRRIFLILFIGSTSILFGQDKAFGKQIVDTLTSEYFWGRGYTKGGLQRASNFLVDQFKTYGLTPISDSSYTQPYSFSANTFPGTMSCSINGQMLVPGKDYLVTPSSRGIKANGKLIQIDSATFINKDERLMVSFQKKLTWSASQKASDYTEIQLLKTPDNDRPKKFDLEIDQEWLPKFEANNICGMVKGTLVPDSFIVLSAHYDHLGGMGREVYFPGANDNASGVSLLLNLARYYAQHPQSYSMVFILFSGEEIGLLGSEYFVNHPLIPLDRIRFLTNTDLAGTGEEGITVVNATIFPKEFELMTKINEEKQWLKVINLRGKAANSDHYHFSEKGVPSFFFYTQGGISAYHDIYDRAETLPLNKHEELFQLIRAFNEALMK